MTNTKSFVLAVLTLTMTITVGCGGKGQKSSLTSPAGSLPIGSCQILDESAKAVTCSMSSKLPEGYACFVGGEYGALVECHEQADGKIVVDLPVGMAGKSVEICVKAGDAPCQSLGNVSVPAVETPEEDPETPKTCDDTGCLGGYDCVVVDATGKKECQNIAETTKGCVSDSDCLSGEACADGTCQVASVVTEPECSATTPCPEGQTCGADGTCQVASVVTEPGCSATTPCPEGQTCGADGTCQEVVALPETPSGCMTHEECPIGSFCKEKNCVAMTLASSATELPSDLELIGTINDMKPSAALRDASSIDLTLTENPTAVNKAINSVVITWATSSNPEDPIEELYIYSNGFNRKSGDGTCAGIANGDSADRQLLVTDIGTEIEADTAAYSQWKPYLDSSEVCAFKDKNCMSYHHKISEPSTPVCRIDLEKEVAGNSLSEGTLYTNVLVTDAKFVLVAKTKKGKSLVKMAASTALEPPPPFQLTAKITDKDLHVEVENDESLSWIEIEGVCSIKEDEQPSGWKAQCPLKENMNQKITVRWHDGEAEFEKVYNITSFAPTVSLAYAAVSAAAGGYGGSYTPVTGSIEREVLVQDQTVVDSATLYGLDAVNSAIVFCNSSGTYEGQEANPYVVSNKYELSAGDFGQNGKFLISIDGAYNKCDLFLD